MTQDRSTWVAGHIAITPRVAKVLIDRVDFSDVRTWARGSDREVYTALATLFDIGIRYGAPPSLERNDPPDQAKQEPASGETPRPSNRWASTAEVADLLKLKSIRRVQQLLAEKQLEGELRSRRWVIDLESVHQYAKRRTA